MASSIRKLHVVVTCTERKTAPVPEHLRLGNIPDGRPDIRASAWVNRLVSDQATESVRVLDLYAGEHWQVAASLPSLAADAGVAAQLWACSAGYGLIPAQTMVRPYAATLSPGHPDSVSGGRPGTVAWWQAIASWEGPEPGAPRTIEELARSDSQAAFLFVLSAAYLQACGTDIGSAGLAVHDPDRFMIVSAGTRPGTQLDRWLLPADARLQAPLGGTRQVLNIRIAADLLAHRLTTHAAAFRHLSSMMEGQQVTRYDRERLPDDKVLAWMRAAQSEMPTASASRLLRLFRDAGYACEQHRFGELHRRLSGRQA